MASILFLCFYLQVQMRVVTIQFCSQGNTLTPFNFSFQIKICQHQLKQIMAMSDTGSRELLIAHGDLTSQQRQHSP